MSGNDAEVRPYVQECESPYETYFTWVVYVIEGVMLVFGAFLSYETRRVKIAALNDSRLIGVCLYNVVVLAALSVTLSLVLKKQLTLLYSILSGFNIIGTTATQLIIFIPKITAVYYPHRVEPDEAETRDGTRLTHHMEKRATAKCTPSGSTLDQHAYSSTVSKQAMTYKPERGSN